jgi:hypothetical protein
VDAILLVLNRYFLVASILCAIAIIPSLMIRVRGEEEDQ